MYIYYSPFHFMPVYYENNMSFCQGFFSLGGGMSSIECLSAILSVQYDKFQDEVGSKDVIVEDPPVDVTHHLLLIPRHMTQNEHPVSPCTCGQKRMVNTLNNQYEY